MSQKNITNVNPQKWGPPFWKLLNTLAQYSEKIPGNMNKDLSEFITSIPYVLPCNICSNHCKQIYARTDLKSIISLTDLKQWVYDLRTQVNKYTNTNNITYSAYILTLRRPGTFINEKQLVDLLAMISISYPNDNDQSSFIKKKYIYSFVQILIKFVTYIPHLQSLGKFVLYHVWKDKKEFQDWLLLNSKKVYHYDVKFNY